MATKIENDEVIPDEELNKIIEEINNEEDKRLKVIVDEYQQLTQNGFFVLDTETTDLVGEVVSFSLIDDKNNILINEYCKPTRNKISKTAQSIHNISNKMIKDSRNIIPIYEYFLKIINTEENKNKTYFEINWKKYDTINPWNIFEEILIGKKEWEKWKLIINWELIVVKLMGYPI